MTTPLLICILLTTILAGAFLLIYKMKKVINQLHSENSALFAKIVSLEKEKNLDMQQAKPKLIVEKNEELLLVTAAEFIKDHDQDALILN